MICFNISSVFFWSSFWNTLYISLWKAKPSWVKNLIWGSKVLFLQITGLIKFVFRTRCVTYVLIGCLNFYVLGEHEWTLWLSWKLHNSESKKMGLCQFSTATQGQKIKQVWIWDVTATKWAHCLLKLYVKLLNGIMQQRESHLLNTIRKISRG